MRFVRECPGDDWEDRRGHSGFGEALPHPTLAFYLVSILAAPGNCECRQPFPSAHLPSGAKQDLLFFSGYCKYSLFIPHPVFFIFFKDSMLDGKVPALPG